MSQTREERRSGLDAFADAIQPNQAVVPVNSGPAAAPAIHGAQKVAVLRDERTVLQKVRTLAAVAGADWYYRFPVKNRKENRTDWIEGPSIKLANDVARLYGNCEVDCRVEDLGSTYLFHARFIDLETGFSLTRPFQQRKSAARIGGADDARRDDMALQIGASKAIRNVVVNALQTISDFAFEEAKEAIISKIGQDLPAWRERTIERTKAHVPLDRVEAVIGRPAKEWLAPDVARVIAMMKAVGDGMASVDEQFPPIGQPDRPFDPISQAEEMEGMQKRQSGLNAFADKVEDVVEEPAGSVASPAGPSAAGEAPSPRTPAEAPAADQADERAAFDPDTGEMIDINEVAMAILGEAMRIAGRTDHDPATRLARLDKAKLEWFAQMPPHHAKFVQTVVEYSVKVARAELAADNAKKYLTALAPKS